MNDLSDSILQSHVLMYADDTVIYASKEVSEIERVLNSQLANLHKWLLENNLFLNKEKTECVLFGSSPRLCKVQNFSIILGNQALRHVVEFKYLGIVMDGSLTWKSHTANLFSKVSKRIGILRRIRNDITLSAADMVYKSFILPLFDYCDTVWTCCNKGDADRLERLQNCAPKTVYECNCSEIAIDALRWGPLSKRRDLHVFKLVKKSLMNTVPQFLMNYFTFNRDITSITTRQSNFPHLPKVKTESAKKSFYL